MNVCIIIYVYILTSKLPLHKESLDENVTCFFENTQVVGVVRRNNVAFAPLVSFSVPTSIVGTRDSWKTGNNPTLPHVIGLLDLAYYHEIFIP